MSTMSSQRRKGNVDAALRAYHKFHSDPAAAEFFKKRRIAMELRQLVRDHPESGLVADDEENITA